MSELETIKLVVLIRTNYHTIGRYSCLDFQHRKSEPVPGNIHMEVSLVCFEKMVHRTSVGFEPNVLNWIKMQKSKDTEDSVVMFLK